MANTATPLLKNPYWKGRNKQASFTVTGQDTQTAFHNTGASGNVTYSLPKAAAGLYFKFLVGTAHTITVTPISTDTIRGKAMGASASNATVGSLLSLICINAGFWEPEINNGGW